MTRINFKGTPQGEGFTPIPQGEYLLQVDDVEEGIAKSSGNPKLTVKCSIVDGEYEGRKAFLNFSLAANAGFSLRGLVEAAIPDKVEIAGTDETTERGDELSEVDFDSDDLIGSQFYATASIEEYNGNANNRWKNFRSTSEGPEGEALDEEAPTEAPPARGAGNGNGKSTAAAKPATNGAAKLGSKTATAPAASSRNRERRLG